VLVVEVITCGGRHPADTGRGEPERVLEAATAGQPATTEPTGPTHLAGLTKSATRTVRRSTAETRELAAKLRAQHPDISQAALARRLGISATRLRQVDKSEVHPELAGRDATRASEVSV
jgi:hypothetical protein